MRYYYSSIFSSFFGEGKKDEKMSESFIMSKIVKNIVQVRTTCTEMDGHNAQNTTRKQHGRSAKTNQSQNSKQPCCNKLLLVLQLKY